MVLYGKKMINDLSAFDADTYCGPQILINRLKSDSYEKDEQID